MGTFNFACRGEGLQMEISLTFSINKVVILASSTTFSTSISVLMAHVVIAIDVEEKDLLTQSFLQKFESYKNNFPPKVTIPISNFLMPKILYIFYQSTN